MYLEAHISNEPELQMNAACQVWFYEAWREGNHINNHRQLQSPEAPQTKAPAWVQSLEEIHLQIPWQTESWNTHQLILNVQYR